MDFFVSQFKDGFVSIFFHKIIKANFKDRMFNLDSLTNLKFKLVNYQI